MFLFTANRKLLDFYYMNYKLEAGEEFLVMCTNKSGLNLHLNKLYCSWLLCNVLNIPDVRRSNYRRYLKENRPPAEGFV